jgi:hypothetical protein
MHHASSCITSVPLQRHASFLPSSPCKIMHRSCPLHPGHNVMHHSCLPTACTHFMHYNALFCPPTACTCIMHYNASFRSATACTCAMHHSHPAPAPCIIPALLLRHASLPPSYSPASVMHHNAYFLPSHNGHQHHSCPQPGAMSCIVMHRYRPPTALQHHHASTCIIPPLTPGLCPPTALHLRYRPPTACIMHCYRPPTARTYIMHYNALFHPPTACTCIMHYNASFRSATACTCVMHYNASFHSATARTRAMHHSHPAPAPCIIPPCSRTMHHSRPVPVSCIITALLQSCTHHAS